METEVHKAGMVTNRHDRVTAILQSLGEHRFESKPFYSPEGDCVYYYFENQRTYNDRVDCWLTAFRSSADDRIVGIKIKNIKTLLSRFQALGFDYSENGDMVHIKLRPVFMTIPLTMKEVNNFLPYRDVATNFGLQLNQVVSLVA
jgi:hypothetical protein